jgi:hypothetical protein
MTLKQRFKQSITCGTGAAYFILRDNPRIDFSKEIENAMIKNLAYDPQAEGDRSIYLAGLINQSGQKQKLIDKILNSLAIQQTDTWSVVQLYALALIFAEQSNPKARQAIIARYLKRIDPDSWCGEDAIVKLDRLQGLKRVAQTRGKELTEDPKDWEDSSRVDTFRRENPHVDVDKELAKATKTDRYVKKYLDAIKEIKELRKSNPKRLRFNYSRVKENIESNYRIPISPYGVKELTKTDIRKLADDFLSESSTGKKEKYLFIFTKTKFPYDYRPILDIDMGKNYQGTRLIELACGALRFFKGKDIRSFAIHKLSRTNRPADYLHLLVSNYKSGDFRLLVKITQKYKKEESVHALVWPIVDIYKSNKTKECRKPLEILYDKLTCGPHRYETLKIMHEYGVLLNRILREMQYDSYEEVRTLHEKIIAKASQQS